MDVDHVARPAMAARKRFLRTTSRLVRCAPLAGRCPAHQRLASSSSERRPRLPSSTCMIRSRGSRSYFYTARTPLSEVAVAGVARLSRPRWRAPTGRSRTIAYPPSGQKLHPLRRQITTTWVVCPRQTRKRFHSASRPPGNAGEHDRRLPLHVPASRGCSLPLPPRGRMRNGGEWRNSRLFHSLQVRRGTHRRFRYNPFRLNP